LLVPLDFRAASGTNPLPLLVGQPLLDPLRPHLLQIGLHRPVMGPLIVHESAQRRARTLGTETTGHNLFLSRTLAKKTLGHRLIHPPAATSVAIQRATRPAIKPTGAELRFLHGGAPLSARKRMGLTRLLAE
jgi:hypothetical protein